MFKEDNLLEFTKRFQTDFDCLSYLAEIKWGNGYVCPKCAYTKHATRKENRARECNRCYHVDSPTANTLFHKLRFGIRKAFLIIYEMSASAKGLSSSQVAKRYGISRTTAWSLAIKVRKAMKSCGNLSVDEDIKVEELLFGDNETLKQGRSTNRKKKEK